MHFYKRLVLIAVAILGLSDYAQAKAPIKSLWEAYSAQHNAFQKVALLQEISNQYLQLNDLGARDSVYELILENLQLSNISDTDRIEIYCSYFNANDFRNRNVALRLADKMMKLSKDANNPKWQFYSYASLAKFYDCEAEYQKALTHSNKAFYYVNLQRDDSLKVRGFLLLGHCLENVNDKQAAFSNYLNALYLSDKMDNVHLMKDCYEALSFFYSQIPNYDKARKYKNLEYDLLLQLACDSVDLMGLRSDLAIILFSTKEDKEASKIIDDVIRFAIRGQAIPLKESAFAIYRRFLIERGDYAKLSNLYTKQYPEELHAISTADTTLFYRLKAFITEADGYNDSARYYYNLAERGILREGRGSVFLSFFYLRYGQFLARIDDHELAKVKMGLSYKYAANAHYLLYMIESTQYLDIISRKLEDYQLAYYYERLNRAYSDTLNMANKESELLMLEIDNIAKQQELEKERLHHETERRHNLQLMAITIVIFTLFIILAMLGSFSVPKWAIRTVGFFSFILFFEFIIMISEHSVEIYTHKEPWKIMLFKLILISILAPTHHWLEHKVLNYLYEHNIMAGFGSRLRTALTPKFLVTPQPQILPNFEEEQLPEDDELKGDTTKPVSPPNQD